MLPLMTAEEFVDQRFDLPESGQWSELEEGILKNFQPPDLDHGNVIRNLSRALGQYVQSGGTGYACFDLGIAVARKPDTIRFPAACHFTEGPRFAEADKPFTEKPPARVLGYHEFGSGMVWVIDPKEKCVHLCPCGQKPTLLSAAQTLHGDPGLPGFAVPVQELFAEPDWWK
jgi:Uma2 family endonuclease